MNYEPNPRRRALPDYDEFQHKNAGDEEKPGARKTLEGRFASLTASLLARKGEAEPALEPFAHARVAASTARQMNPGETHRFDHPKDGAREGAPDGTKDGTKDGAGDGVKERLAEKAAETAPERAVRKPNPLNREEARAPGFPALDDAPRLPPATRIDPAAPFADNCPREKIAKSPKRAAVTFRMSVHDFLRLKLASAEMERSSQDIIIDAVEAWLDIHEVERLDDCRCLRQAGDACATRAAQSGEEVAE